MRFGIGMSLTLILCLAGTPPAQTQEQPTEPLSVFTDVVDVRVVNLEVVVTDRQGRPVFDLEPQQFRLLVDGKEVPIDYFTEIRESRAVAGSEDAAVQGVPAVAAGEVVGTSYLIFIDDFFPQPKDRDLVIRKLMDDLDSLEPGDQMAIVAYDGTHLEMLSIWERSPDRIRRAYRRALMRPAYGLARMADQREVATATRSVTPEGGRFGEAGPTQGADATEGFLEENPDVVPGMADVNDPELTSFERLHVRRLEQQIEAITSAAAATLRSFARPPGRKVMVLLSGGWPYSPAGFLTERAPGRLVDLESSTVEQLYGPLADTANRLGYTLYAVDVPASSLAFSPVDARVQSEQEQRQRDVDAPSRRTGELQYTLEFLANRTGGKAMVGGDRESALARVADDTRNYYWIGFTPKWREDDRSRDIRVEVTEPSLRVRSRSSFLDMSRDHSVGMVLESALLFGSPPQPHQLPMKVGEVRRAGRRQFRVPLAVAIPVDAVAFLPQRRRFMADLELRAVVRDESGREVGETPAIPFQVRLDEAPPSGTYVPYETELRLRSDPSRIVVTVYDKAGGAILSGVIDRQPK